MSLIDALSATRQKLVSSVPVALGVRQYVPVVLRLGNNTYNFTAKITELTPGQKAAYLNSGVTVNQETRSIADIPLSIPFEAVQYGTYSYAGKTADVMFVNTNGVVSYVATVQEYRDI